MNAVTSLTKCSCCFKSQSTQWKALTQEGLTTHKMSLQVVFTQPVNLSKEKLIHSPKKYKQGK